jgi:hypothetical protein
MPIGYLTVDEVISTIRHSSLPTLLVEGKDDMTIMRWLESKLPKGISILACSCRNDLLAVYARRAELAGFQVAFLADRDEWVFSSLPEEFNEIVFTFGYSIENDLLMSARLEEIMELGEKEPYLRDIAELARWFGFYAEALKQGLKIPCSYHPNRIIPTGTFRLCTQLCEQHGFTAPTKGTYNNIRRSYKKYIRGKSIIELLLRYLSSTHRQSKYSRTNLLEIGVKGGRRPIQLFALTDALSARF